MPLYEYECDSCGRRFEVIQKFSDPAVEVCSVCGGTVHKLVSSSAFQFKGQGWYVTDYARKETKEKPSTEPAKSEGGPAKDDKSSPASGSTPASPSPAGIAPTGSSSKDS